MLSPKKKQIPISYIPQKMPIMFTDKDKPCHLLNDFKPGDFHNKTRNHHPKKEKGNNYSFKTKLKTFQNISCNRTQNNI